MLRLARIFLIVGYLILLVQDLQHFPYLLLIVGYGLQVWSEALPHTANHSMPPREAVPRASLGKLFIRICRFVLQPL